MEHFISAENLAFQYPGVEGAPDVTVFENLNLTIEEGSFTAILGINGCGKSTLAKLFNAILVPSGGKMKVCGLDTSDPDLLMKVRRNVGMVFQNPDNQIVANVVAGDIPAKHHILHCYTSLNPSIIILLVQSPMNISTIIYYIIQHINYINQAVSQ